MMALESSVFGCGSDDWSVDSDYAFQDFADDVKQRQPSQQQDQKDGQLLQPSAPTPEQRIQGTSSSMGVLGNFEAGRKEALREVDSDPEAAEVQDAKEEAVAEEDAEAAAAFRQPSAAKVAQGEGGEISGVEEKLTPKIGASARGENAQDSATGFGGDDTRPSWPSNARLFGDSGTSTDNTHILRLEQRMFLKVLIVLFRLEPGRMLVVLQW